MFYSAAADLPLPSDQIRELVTRALDDAPLANKRVLVVIPDGTRSGPIGPLWRLMCEQLLGRVAAFDTLIALGTHQPMNTAQILARLELTQVEYDALKGRAQIFNHEWWRPETFFTAGTISADEINALTHSVMNQAVSVRLNKLIQQYDQIILCGPVFPHEVVGFSGGSKYLFPGIAGSEIINFTHWLGALLTSYAIIGTRDTPVRAVIERAADFVTTPRLDFCLVVRDTELVGLYIGDTRDVWRSAADHSARVNVSYLDRPVQRVVSLIPPMYDDLWTAAKGMYKVEPVVGDNGEVILYAPSLHEISRTHGEQIQEIGYHVRDYFVKQWDRFKHYPWGVLAHSSHLRGLGEYDAARHIETPRLRVTLATGISRERCAQINLDHMDPALIYTLRHDSGTLIVPKAGERLYRLKPTPLDTRQDNRQLK